MTSLLSSSSYGIHKDYLNHFFDNNNIFGKSFPIIYYFIVFSFWQYLFHLFGAKSFLKTKRNVTVIIYELITLIVATKL